MSDSHAMETKNLKNQIIETVKGKSTLKQKVYDNTLTSFNLLKEVLQELCDYYNDHLIDADSRVLLEYKDNGIFSAQLKVAGDILIFGMHSNVFEFDREHGVWKTSYIQSNRLASYCGIINIYNFLSDSFKYNRWDDLGYLIGRIFINNEMHYFVEGKRQLGFFYNNFGKDILDKKALEDIANLAINYSLEFDLLVPPYDAVKIINVEQISQRIQFSLMKTGKRLGFRFNSDDVSANSKGSV
jgi:hypothetical protein